MTNVVIIDYGSGNLHSIAKAVEHVSTNETIIVSDKPSDIQSADRIILPGVGAFGDCIRGLNAHPDIIDSLNEAVIKKERPFLGICVGMQMLADVGLEHGTHHGLGWFHGEVIPIPRQDDIKIPHMGWNQLQLLQNDHPILKDIKDGDHAYFVHSYHFKCKEEDTIIATTSYPKPLVAIIAKANMVATQFHPEKSQETGLTLLRNFLTV
jgi:glutamine amidotransferase